MVFSLFRLNVELQVFFNLYSNIQIEKAPPVKKRKTAPATDETVQPINKNGAKETNGQKHTEAEDEDEEDQEDEDASEVSEEDGDGDEDGQDATTADPAADKLNVKLKKPESDPVEANGTAVAANGEKE